MIPAGLHLLVAVLAALLLAGPSLGVVKLRVGQNGGAPAFPHTNGRQIVRNSDGVWFVVYDVLTEGGRSIQIAVSRSSDPEAAGDFHPPVTVVGSHPEAAIRSAADVKKSAAAIDSLDTLHLVWESGGSVWRASCKTQGKDAAPLVEELRRGWSHPAGAAEAAGKVNRTATPATLGDIALDPAGRVWITYTEAVQVPANYSYPFRDAGKDYRQALRGGMGHEIWAASYDRDGWKRRRLTVPGPAAAPVTDIDRTGTLHLVFAGDRASLLYLQVPQFASAVGGAEDDLTRIVPMAVWSGSNYVSYSVAGWGDRALVVFERTEYVNLYAYYDGKSWSVGEIHSGGREIYRHPILTRDEHDIAWVFWVNSTRGHTFLPAGWAHVSACPMCAVP